MANGNGTVSKAMELAKSVTFWLKLILALMAVYGGAAAAGVNIPRWAWVSEVRKVSDRVDNNTVELLEGTVRNLKTERRGIEREKKAVIKKGGEPGPRLLKDEEEANDAIRRLENRLKKIRGF